jgi:hypothetical protein
VRLTTSSCKNKFVENLLREKNARRDQGSMGCGATDDDDDIVVLNDTHIYVVRNAYGVV